jgi:hypothetical protein
MKLLIIFTLLTAMAALPGCGKKDSTAAATGTLTITGSGS